MQNIPNAPKEFYLKVSKVKTGFKITSEQIPGLELSSPWFSTITSELESAIHNCTVNEEEK